jgi:hypothetical protein
MIAHAAAKRLLACSRPGWVVSCAALMAANGEGQLPLVVGQFVGPVVHNGAVPFGRPFFGQRDLGDVVLLRWPRDPIGGGRPQGPIGGRRLQAPHGEGVPCSSDRPIHGHRV